jgi:hypothetical protein
MVTTNGANYNQTRGLRYNNWWNGDIGYISMYDKWIGYSEINYVYNSTKLRYI